ncbi:MAG: hypothetical protein QN187_01155 [Armatimonadota bacterium]|nr:hypothetical protein [Armatimonadota bacterium]MDR7518033.1 hypothetical protein [Armatimonadota bacterium]MDR7550496.1 hypothetical protein [Armatimonadota bacterium]
MAARTSWGRRLLVATLAAYAAGYAVEIALGHWDPRRVGWGPSYLPVAAEGAVFAFLLRGVWGIVLVPLPLLLVPETWARVARLWDLVGPAGLLLLAQPLPVMWLAGVVGAGIRRLSPWLSGE